MDGIPPPQRRDGYAPIARADVDLRRPCELLIGQPISSSDWADADLLSMDGLDATDEQLLSYWLSSASRRR